MAKILFWGDPDRGRHDEVTRLLSEGKKRIPSAPANASYGGDQLQYLLTVMLILTVAEKRTEFLYQRDFAKRCDDISDRYGLENNQYWSDEEIPAEWKALDAEFEQQSSQILLVTLKEYQLDDIAERVRTKGPKQLYDIVANLKDQFFKVLKHFAEGNSAGTSGKIGSIPETLES
jgi:hypothetical protein